MHGGFTVVAVIAAIFAVCSSCSDVCTVKGNAYYYFCCRNQFHSGFRHAKLLQYVSAFLT